MFEKETTCKMLNVRVEKPFSCLLRALSEWLIPFCLTKSSLVSDFNLIWEKFSSPHFSVAFFIGIADSIVMVLYCFLYLHVFWWIVEGTNINEVAAYFISYTAILLRSLYLFRCFSDCTSSSMTSISLIRHLTSFSELWRQYKHILFKEFNPTFCPLASNSLASYFLESSIVATLVSSAFWPWIPIIFSVPGLSV